MEKNDIALATNDTHLRVFASSEGTVWKHIHTFDDAVVESVIYRYPTFQKRTVLCVSIQCGCMVGCTFCGTGKRFVRNLKADEIISQVTSAFTYHNIDPDTVETLQIMFMSMGEPFHNYSQLSDALERLNAMYPNASLLVSTSAPNNPNAYKAFLDLSVQIDKIGLQFSVHKSNEADRGQLIPFKNKLSMFDFRNYGMLWWKTTGRKLYCNYCIDGTNNTIKDAEQLMALFPPMVFNFTFSVVCSHDENMKNAGYRNLKQIREFEEHFMANGYNTRVFDPAGQDDIGGGCGMLLYFQQWIKHAK